MQNFPSLIKGQVAVLQAAVATGHVYDIHGQLVIGPDQQMYSVFDSLEAAQVDLMLRLSKSDLFEYTMFDHSGEFIAKVDP